MAHAGGRPSKLDAAFIQKAEEYLLGYEERGDVIPSIAGLALYTRVRRSTIHSWLANIPDVSEDLKEQFMDIIGELQEEQEQKLLSGGLSGSFNATITKLVLSKHDYSDKVEQSHTSDGSFASPGTLNVTISRPKGD